MPKPWKRIVRPNCRHNLDKVPPNESAQLALNRQAASRARRLVSKASWWLLGIALICGFARPADARLDPSQVAILVNRDVALSSKVAHMYQRLRAIPDANILRLSLGSDRRISTDHYWKDAGPSIKKYLEAHPEIRCVVTTSGDPYTIRLSGGDNGIVAFDSELAGVLREDSGDVHSRLPNPLYLDGMNPYGATDPRLLKMIYVARLDGPDLETVTRMVQDAIATEQTGLQGPVFGDARGIESITGYGIGDTSVRQAIDRLSGAGLPATLDLKEETWLQPAGGVGDQAAGAAFYLGWYRLRDFQNIFGPHGLARGSIAWHIASGEAEDLWNPGERGWCVNLLRHGAAVTLGPVAEPYVQAFPRGDVFTEALLTGQSVAESYWLSLPNISWRIVLLGDPMYRPLALHPRPALVASAYVADNVSHILGPGETAPLQVEIECVGPPGSATPALSAAAEPEAGLMAASGKVSIPAMRAGETQVVRVPSVTAANHAGGQFRLRLSVQTDGEQSRRIVLEGRIGMSRLTWGPAPKLQMFISPNGDLLVTGLPGRSALVNTETLRTLPITPPNGLLVANVSFAPDSGHILMDLIEPKQKSQAVVLVDSQLTHPQALAPGSRFLRWLDKDRIIVEDQNRILSRSITGGAEQAFDTPEGWSGGTIIPGTGVQVFNKSDGSLAVRKGDAPLRKILQGTNVKTSIGIANDLSVFGGLDDQKRFWVQHGFEAAPKVVDEAVERVVWGPISRVAVVLEAGGRGHVYDSRDDSWLDLGVISEAAWSPDEQRLAFVQGAGAGSLGTLAMLSNRHIQPLYNLNEIGPVRTMRFAGEDRVFAQAGPTGEVGIWMLALPRN